MFTKLLAFYENCHYVKQSMTLDLSHDKCCGWYLEIVHRDSETTIFAEDNTSLNLLGARAYVALEEWAREDFKLCDIEPNLGI